MDLIAHLYRQRACSRATFGPGMRTKGVSDHIRKELKETEAKPADLYEWVDVILLALDGAWRCGATPEQIAVAIERKQSRNEDRGGPAFPQSGLRTEAGVLYAPMLGMSLRDWLAGQALTAVVKQYAEANGGIGTDHLLQNCPVHAYRIADAMLDHRNRRED